MSWDKEPPQQVEMANTGWDSAPPRDSEVSQEPGALMTGVDYILRGLDAAGGVVRTASSQISDAALPVRNKILEAIGSDYREKPMYQEGDWGRAMVGQAPSSAEQMERAGIPEGSRVDLMPEVKVPFTDVTLGKGDSSARDVGGFALDVASDPLNYATFGGASVVKNAGKNAIKEAGEKAARGVGESAAAQTIKQTGNVVSETARSTKKAIGKLFSPTLANDFEQLKNIAKKNNIPEDLLPESIEFGKDSMISRASRAKMEGPLGEEALNKFNDGLDLVRGKVEELANNVSGGVAPDAVDAGIAIRDGFDRGVDKFFSNVDMTHNKLMKAIPNLKLSPDGVKKISSKLSGLEKWAKGRASRGITATDRTQADQILRAVEQIKRGNGSYKQTYEALRDIGEVAFKAKNSLADIPPDIAKFRDLYFTIDDALIDTASKAAGEPVAQSMRETNRAISEFLGERSLLSKTIGRKDLSPEKLFNSLVVNGDVKRLQALKKILSPEDFKILKGAFIKSQIKKNADDVFTFKGLHNNLRGKKNALGELLDAQEIESLNELIQLGNRWGDPILSYSGTGASGAFRSIGQTIRSTVENDTLVNYLKNKARKNAGYTSKNLDAPSAQAIGLERARPKQLSTTIEQPKISTEKFKRDYKNLYRVSPAAARFLAYSSKNENGEVRGKGRWRIDGFNKLQAQDRSGLFNDPKFVNKLVTSQKGLNILERASSVSSPKMLSSILNEATMLKGTK